ncbi:MAG: YdcF family protein [Phycisphaerae bacterium]
MADDADVPTPGGDLPVRHSVPGQPPSRRRKMPIAVIGSILDTIAIVFIISALISGRAGWWITLPGPAWIHFPLVCLWCLAATAYWVMGRIARFDFKTVDGVNIQLLRTCWEKSKRSAAMMIGVILIAEWLTWLLMAMLIADTIRYYQIWAATGGDVSCWVPMCLVVTVVIGSWMAMVRYRRAHAAQLAIDPRRGVLGWIPTIGGVVAIVVCSYLKAHFPHPPRHPVGLAVVLGNHVLNNDTPGCTLRGRLRAALWLYRHGLVKYVMVSGRAKYGRDHARRNESLAMAVYCLEHHIPDHALIVDYDGNNTRYTAYHAVEWMHQHHIKQVVGVSSIYHLPRIYLAFHQLGVNPYTMASIKRSWKEINPWGLLRECVAVPVYALDPHYHQPPGGLHGD